MNVFQETLSKSVLFSPYFNNYCVSRTLFTLPSDVAVQNSYKHTDMVRPHDVASIRQSLWACKKIWGCLTSFYAVLHQVSVQTSSSNGFRRTPLYGHCGVGDIVYNQHGGLTGDSWMKKEVLEISRVIAIIPHFIFQQWILTRKVSKVPLSLSLAGMLSISMLDLISPCSCHLFLYSESYLTPIETSDRPDLLNL